MTGSSPRLRGTRRGVLADERSPRFIPAFAGNARDRIVPGRGVSVHPRVCGERPQPALSSVKYGGSSPRLRGTQGQGAGHAVHVRFIPAFAGNARSRQCSGKTRSVHPRVCGERSTKEIAAARGYGSSPRLRGTLPGVNRLGHGRRFIPAFAGNAYPNYCGR